MHAQILVVACLAAFSSSAHSVHVSQSELQELSLLVFVVAQAALVASGQSIDDCSESFERNNMTYNGVRIKTRKYRMYLVGTQQ